MLNCILIDSILVDILKYLNLKELAIVRITSKTFHRLIDLEPNIIYDKFKISFFDDKINLKWLLNIVKKNRIKKCNLLLCDNPIYIRKIITHLDFNYLENLKIPSQYFTFGHDIIRFYRLKKLTIKNMHFIENDLDQDVYMINNLIQMPWIKKLKLNNIKFIDGSFFEKLKNKVYLIDLTESDKFKIQDFSLFIKNQYSCLKILKLDGEYSDENKLAECLVKFDNLEELYIGYCQYFTDFIFTILLKVRYRLKKLTLRKLRISSQSLTNFFENFEISQLIKLDFRDCTYLTNECVHLISNKALKLQYLEISWAENIEDDSIINLLNKCVDLKVLILQGCKNLTDEILKNIFDYSTIITPSIINKISFNSLKLIDFSKCDFISDSIIYKILSRYPFLSIINYYGFNLKYNDY